MGGSGGGDSYDAAYNAVMSGIYQEQHDWSGEYMNKAKYGVDYDPDTEVKVYEDEDGNLIEAERVLNPDYVPSKEETWEDHEGNTRTKVIPAQGEQYIYPGGDSAGTNYTTKTLGEIRGYDPTTPTFWGMEQQQIADNMAIMPYQKATNISGLEAQEAGYNTQKLTSEAAQSLIDPTTNLALSKIQSEQAILPGQTALTQAQNQYGTQQAISNTNLIGVSENAARAGYQYNTAKANTDRSLLDPWAGAKRAEYGYATDKFNADRSLIPGQTQLRGALNTEALSNVALRAPVTAKFYRDSYNGVDVGQRMNQAGAEVANQFANAEKETGVALSRYGINPNSGRGRSEFAKTGMAYAGAVGGARNQARDSAEKENYSRLNTAVNARTQPQQAIY